MRFPRRNYCNARAAKKLSCACMINYMYIYLCVKCMFCMFANTNVFLCVFLSGVCVCLCWRLHSKANRRLLGHLLSLWENKLIFCWCPGTSSGPAAMATHIHQTASSRADTYHSSHQDAGTKIVFLFLLSMFFFYFYIYIYALSRRFYPNRP